MAGGDGFERGLEAGVGVDPVHFGRFDEAGDARPGCGAFVVSGEQRVLAVQRQRPDGVFHDVVHLDALRTASGEAAATSRDRSLRDRPA